MESKWIKEKVACEWLGVSPAYLYNLRAAGKINYSYMQGQRGLMYDQKSIEKLLQTNSLEEIQKKL